MKTCGECGWWGEKKSSMKHGRCYVFEQDRDVEHPACQPVAALAVCREELEVLRELEAEGFDAAIDGVKLLSRAEAAEAARDQWVNAAVAIKVRAEAAEAQVAYERERNANNTAQADAEVALLRRISEDLLELAEDLRSYTHDWDWKYGDYWDPEIEEIKAALKDNP